MASQAEIDIEAELDEWLRKEAMAKGVDSDMESQELEMWKQWKQAPTTENFGWLLNAHQGMIHDAAKTYLSAPQIPRAAVKSDMLRNYIYALDKYDPSKGAKLGTWVNLNMGHTGRYLADHTNIGKIPEKRRAIIDLFKNRQAELHDKLGRMPTSSELADDMNLAMQDVAELQGKSVTTKTVGTLTRELQQSQSRISEAPGGEGIAAENSRMRDHLVFMPGSLNPEQQLVLEHTFPDWGRPVIDDPMQLGKAINMSPQKVRAIKKQILNRVQKYM